MIDDKQLEDRIPSTENRAVQVLIDILRSIGYDPWAECYNVVERYKTSIKQSLARKTQLSLPKNHRATIEISSDVPVFIRDLLNTTPEIFLWLLARERDLSQMSTTLREIIAREQALMVLSGCNESRGSPERTRALTEKTLEIMREFFRRLLRGVFDAYEGDILGYYDINNSTVTLNWVVIFLSARALGVSVVSLAYVVLTHELAHMYTHMGQDANDDSWNTDHFARLDPRICEGLAQWYTQENCRQCESQSDWVWLADNPLEAFNRLFDRQSKPYQDYVKWVPGHRKDAEVIRQSMIQFGLSNHRTNPRDYDCFLGLIQENAKRLSS